jgi:hypothetical protein
MLESGIDYRRTGTRWRYLAHLPPSLGEDGELLYRRQSQAGAQPGTDIKLTTIFPPLPEAPIPTVATATAADSFNRRRS